MIHQYLGIILGMLLLIPVGFALAILGPYLLLLAIVHWRLTLLLIVIIIALTCVSAINNP